MSSRVGFEGMGGGQEMAATLSVAAARQMD